LFELQVTVAEPEAYAFDEEVIKKAAELGKPGLVDIKQRQDTFIFRVEGTGVLPVRCVTTYVILCYNI
jgi:DNA-directed RNA polymerase II subunit RPB3